MRGSPLLRTRHRGTGTVNLIKKMSERQLPTIREMDPFFPMLATHQGVIYQTIIDVEQKIQSPHALILSSLLSVLSLACQPKRRVVHPSGQKSPLSLYLFTLAASGERKTATDAELMKSIVEFQRQQDGINEASDAKFETLLYQWEHRRKYLDRQITKHWAKKLDATDLESQRDTHDTAKPVRTKGVKLQIDNVTPAAFLKFFDRYYPATSIIADEGAGSLSTFATSNVGNLNNSWNGKTLYVERVSTDSFTVEDPRLTVHLMLQPSIFENAVQKKNNIWEESGLLARALFAAPASRIGRRTNERPILSAYTGELDFHRRIAKILRDRYRAPLSNEVEDIEFSPAAARRWNDYLFSTEKDMATGARYAKITAAASKAAENVARIAALLQCFEDCDHERANPIRHENVEVAIEICDWYLLQQKNYFAPDLAHPGEEYAAMLWQWIWGRANYDTYLGGNALQVKLIAKIANPRLLRKAAVWQPALDYLEHTQHLVSQYVNSEEYVVISPAAPAPPGFTFRRSGRPGT